MNYNVRNASGILVWLDADDYSTCKATIGGSAAADAGTIAEWQDKSGNANHAQNNTGSNLPQIYRTTGTYAPHFQVSDELSKLNPRVAIPGVYFNVDFLTFGTALGEPSEYSIYLVVSVASVSVPYVFCGGASSGSAKDSWGLIGQELGGTAGDGKIAHTYGDGTLWRSEEIPTQTLYQYRPQIIALTKRAGVGLSDCFINGNDSGIATRSGTAVNSSPTGTTFELGKYPTFSSFFLSGWIHEFILCDEAHSKLEMQEVGGYLAYKYGFIARKGFVQVPKVIAKAGTSNLLKVNFPAVTENRLQKGLSGFAARIKTPDGAQANLSNSISEVGFGVYEFSLAASEVDAQGGGSVVVKHALCDDVFIPLEIEDPSIAADHVLKRTTANIESSTHGDTLTGRSLYGVVASAKHKKKVDSGYLKNYKSDNITELDSRAITTSTSAAPITEVE